MKTNERQEWVTRIILAAFFLAKTFDMEIKKMKPWWKSKMVWVGILQLVGAISLYLIGYFQDNETITSPMEITLLVNGIVMVILRWLTSEPITSIVKPLDKLRPRIEKTRSNGESK
jgi:hypothetical protein